MPVGPTKTKAQKAKVVKTEMHKFGQGKLHSGSKSGPVVTNPKQAVAIAMSESKQSKKGKKVMPKDPGLNEISTTTLRNRDAAAPKKRSAAHLVQHQFQKGAAPKSSPARNTNLRMSGNSGAHCLGKKK